MYHHHSQQQGPPQPFSNKPRPSHHQQPPTQQQQSRPATDMLSQVLGFQFPPPTQLPDELESALAIRGSRDMDHRLMDHMNRPNQHQNQGSGPAMGQHLSEHGGYSSNPVTLTSDNQQGHQQGVDWSSYQQPTKLFANPPSSASHQPQQHQGLQQQPQNSHSGTGMPSWNAPATDLPSPQTQPSHSGGNSGGVDVQGLYTPESAGSILASFGLSNEDLEVLSHYPDDQLTPDTLPFILRDIQINKSNNQNNAASSSSASYSQSVSHGIHDMPPPSSHSPEVPSLLSVTQTAGKVIDYGHASRAKDESSGRETFKREPLTSERTVKMLYPSPSSSSASKHKVEMPERRQVRLEPAESNKHGDLDYRRPSSDIHKTKRSPIREFPPSSKSRRPDRDYRRDGPKLRPSSETRSESSSLSRRSLSSSSVSKPHGSTKKLPTPTMISDFSAEPPKVYPHTCSLCHIQCDQAKDWIDHVNTVNHTAACRDLRNKYPDWKPKLPRRDPSLAQDGSQAPWHPKVRSPSRSVSRSLSWSPTPSPPLSKHRVGPHPPRQHSRPYPPYHHPRHQHHTEHSHRLEPRSGGIHSPTHSHKGSSSSHRPERRASESSGVSTGSSSRGGLKRPHDDSAKRPIGTGHHSSSLASKMGQRSKSGSAKALAKMGFKPGTKMTKPTSSKAVASKEFDISAKPPSAKKKKKGATSTYQSSTAAARLVYLTGIPADASEQEVTDLVGFFGKINNVVLMPSSEGEGEGEKGEGQKASVCMVRAEDAQALAHCTSLSIRDQQITASLAKKTETEKSFSDVNKGKPGPPKDKCAAGEDPGSETDQKTSDEKGVILISGLPESGWSKSDIIKLVQPFGTPSDIILAAEIGKVLVSLPDVETAEEMVKVHTFIPVKIKDSELKMINLKQPISLSTPVALYNILNGSLGPLETPAPIGWSSLLVISNVPDTLTGPSEVQKLAGRFGTIRKTLTLNNNTIICEMATAGMALAVYKRFQKFPCIIQNNPLSFSRKPDPKASTQTKVIAAYLDSAKDSPAKGKDSQTTPAGKEVSEHQENGESASEGKEKVSDGKDGEKMEGVEENGREGEVEGEKTSKNEDGEVKKDEAAGEVSDSAAAPDSKPEADIKAATMETAPVTTDVKKPGENEPVNGSQAENTKTPSNQKETNTSSTDGDEATSSEPTNPELPKVTQEMVDALLEECRTRTTGHPNQTTVYPGEEQGEAKAENAGGEGEEGREVEKEEKDLVKNNKEEEEKKQKQEREKKEREVKKQEAREKENKERERRAWEWEERTRRERERREEERRERERRERERRDKRRTHREGSSGSRSSGRSEASKRSAGRDGQDRTTLAEKAKKVVEEEADFDDFPFDMGDFVTVDEVGDVTDLPRSPSLPSSVPMETTEEEAKNTLASVQQDTPEAIPTVLTMATTDLETACIPETSETHGSEPESVTAPTAALENRASSDSTSGPVLTPEAAPSPNPQSSSQTDTPASQPEPEATPETVTTTTPTVDSTPVVESLPASVPATTGSLPETALVPSVEADACTEAPAAGGVKGVEKVEEEDSPANSSPAEGEETVAVVSEKPKEEKRLQDEEDEEKRAPVVGTAKRESSADEKSDEECVKKKLKTQAPLTEDSLPPFDPNNPVGMEFLVPKTGFFCKVCNRFFSGTQEAEIAHCKGLKHYESLQKYLQTRKTANATVKPKGQLNLATPT